MNEEILTALEGKWADGTRPKDIYSDVVSRNPEGCLGLLLGGLSSTARKVQSGCAEILSLLSEDRPELLYPHIGLLAEGLEAGEPVLRWEAVCTLGNLAAVDQSKIVLGHLDRIAEFLESDSIVLQGHSVRALTKIAAANEDLMPKVLERLLDSASLFPGNRVGFLLESMEAFTGKEELIPAVRGFAEPYLDSEIPVVARKAKRLLRKLDRPAPSTGDRTHKSRSDDAGP